MAGKQKHNFIRCSVAALLVLISCLFFSRVTSAGETPAEQDAASVYVPDLELKLDYGYRNTAKTGQLLPVTVTVDNRSGDTIGGFLSVEIPGTDGSISYTTSVSIPEGQTVFKRTVTIPDGISSGDGDRLGVRLVDDSGSEIASAETTVTYLGSGREVFCGILSDDPQDLSYLGNISLGDSLSTRIVTLNPADLPDSEDGLNQLDIIVMSSIDLNRLSTAAAEAVMDWVEDGGTLILGTGDNHSPLGAFRSLTGSPELGLLESRAVDLGMQYSTSGPDGAVVNLSVRTLSWDGAETILESGGDGTVLRREFGKGSVSIAVFDLCALKPFGSEHPAFAQDLLTAAVGQTGIARISGSLRSAEERLVAAEELTNTYDGSVIPGIGGFAAGAVLFVLLAGFILFRVLSSGGLGVYYMLGVLILSTAFALLFWLSASSLRITGPFIRYGVITEFSISGGNAAKTGMRGYIDLQSASVNAVTLELPENCMVRPVITNGAISVTAGKKKMLAVTGQKQFETNIFQVEQKEEDRAAALPAEVILNLGENGYSGRVINTGTAELSGLALVIRGEIFRLGTLGPGEERTFGSESSLQGPCLLPGLVNTVLQEAEPDVKYAQQRNSLRADLLRENMSLTEGKALLIGFEEGSRPAFLEHTVYDTEGSSMFAVEISLPETDGDSRFLMIPETEPRVISGSYDGTTECIKGSGAVVLEYSLGSGYELTGIRLKALSRELEGKGVTAFSGQISIYNYSTGVYDLVDAGKEHWSAAELRSYLSPANNLTLRFLPDEDSKSGQPVYLPRLYVEGESASQMSGGPMHAGT